MDTLYYERSGGAFAAWTYSDGRKIYLHLKTLTKIKRYAKRYRYRLIFVHYPPLRAPGWGPGARRAGPA